jgi:hypothetical protein
MAESIFPTAKDLQLTRVSFGLSVCFFFYFFLYTCFQHLLFKSIYILVE